MAQNDQQQNQQPAGAQPAAAQQGPQPRPCPQDCRMCGVNQQIFCTTKMLFMLSRTAQDLSQRMSVLELTLDDIKAQVQPKVEDGQLSLPFEE